MANKLALFDCDGTLVDSQGNICGAMEQAFMDAQLPVPERNDIRRIVGLSIFEAVHALAPELEGDALADLAEGYKQSFIAMRQKGLVEEPLYDGMAELIQHLNDTGWMLGVATGKSDRGLNKCLDHHGLLKTFVTLQTADRHPSKPHPSMIYQAMADAGSDAENTIMIGDTTFDIDMAKTAGCKSIGVSWGYHEISELQNSGADEIANSMSELQQYLESLS